MESKKTSKSCLSQRNAKDNPTTELFCGSVYEPIWWSLMTVGIDWRIFVKTTQRSILRRVIFAIIGPVYFITMLSHMIVIVVHGYFLNPVVTIVEMSFLTYIVVNTTQVLIMYAIFSFGREKFAQFLLKLNHVCETIMGKDIKNFKEPRRFAWLCLATAFTVIFTLLVAIMTESKDGDTGQLGAIILPNSIDLVQLAPMNSSEVSWWQSVELSLYAFGAMGIIGCHSVFVSGYIVTAKLILSNFTHLKSKYRAAVEDGHKNDVNDPMKLVESHRLLCEVVQLFDENFREIVAIWNSAEIFGLIFLLRAINIQPLKSEWSLDWKTVVMIFTITLTFVVKAVLAAGINEKVKTSLSLVYGTSSNVVVDKSLSKINTVADFYCCSVEVNPPLLTGWRLYVVSKGLILNASAYVLTYVLVLYSIKDTSIGNPNL